MKKQFNWLMAGVKASALCLLTLLYGCCKPEVAGNVSNTLRPQQTNNWCWAATTQMLAQHFDITVSQCDLANQVIGTSGCCSASENPNDGCRRNDECNRPGWPELDRVGLKFEESGASLSWATLREQIYCAKKPMGFAYGWSGYVGHVLVIKGYITLAGTNYLVLNDPWSPCIGEERIITYEEYQDPSGPMPADSTTHWTTFYNIAKK